MASREVPISHPDEMVEGTEVAAAQRGISVRALIWAEEESVMGSGVLQVGEITWTRQELHSRTGA